MVQYVLGETNSGELTGGKIRELRKKEKKKVVSNQVERAVNYLQMLE